LQAQVEGRYDGRRRLDLTVRQRLRQGDAAPRRLRLEARDHVRRAGLQAEAAVHASRQVLLARPNAKLVLVLVRSRHAFSLSRSDFAARARSNLSQAIPWRARFSRIALISFSSSFKRSLNAILSVSAFSARRSER
jgi:hypothetical protein